MSYGLRWIKDERQLVESELWSALESLFMLRVRTRQIARTLMMLEGDSPLSATMYELESSTRFTFDAVADLLEQVKLGDLDMLFGNKEDYDNE